MSYITGDRLGPERLTIVEAAAFLCGVNPDPYRVEGYTLVRKDGAALTPADKSVKAMFDRLYRAAKEKKLNVNWVHDIEITTATGHHSDANWDTTNVDRDTLIEWTENEGIKRPSTSEIAGGTKAQRVEAFKEFLNDIYNAGKQRNLQWAKKGGPLPFTKQDFLDVFFERYSGLTSIKHSTFKSEYQKEIGANFAPGIKIGKKPELKELLSTLD